MAVYLLLILFAAAGAAFGQGCGPIQFQSASQITVTRTDPGNFVRTSFGMQRMPDGSFRRHRYEIVTPFRKIDTVDNFQTAFANCGDSLAPPTVRVTPNLAADRFGTPSRNPVMTDLIGDGTGAVIFTDYVRGTLLVNLGTAEVTQRGAQRSYAVGEDPENVLVFDVNGDGRRDVIVSNSGNQPRTPGNIAVLLGNGDGTLANPVTYNAGSNPVGFTIADFNGDGRPDIAAANRASNNVSILLGNGNGTFQAAVGYPAGDFPVSVAGGDLNGDGNMDLVAVGFGDGARVLLGNGNGTFRAVTIVPLTSGGRSVTLADFNKDGRLDAAVAEGNAGAAAVLIGNGAGGFSAVNRYVVGYLPESILAMDFDLDGNLDLNIAAGHPDAVTPHVFSEAITVLYGRGDGTFRGPGAYAVERNSQGMVYTDFNGDGRGDIAVIANMVSVLLGRADGTFQPARFSTIQQGQFYENLATADFNRDGRADIITGSRSGIITVALGTGDGGFQAPTNIATPNWVRFIATGDLNGDGRPDAVATNGLPFSTNQQVGENIVVLLGLGNGAFQPPVFVRAGPNPAHVALADVNGDGRLDAVVTNQGILPASSGPPPNAGGTSILLGNGDGTFRAPVSYPAGSNPDTTSVGDFNGDNRPDIVTASGGGFSGFQLHTFLGRGDGTFTARQSLRTDFGPSDIAIADFSGDGKNDLAVAHCCGDTLMSYLVGNGDGTFQSEVLFPAADSPYRVVAADLNGDRKPDLIVGHSGSSDGIVAVFLNTSRNGRPIVNVSAASNAVGPVAPESIVSAYGTGVAATTAIAQTIPPPLDLGGTTVKVRDSFGAERDAGLFFVSPGQVNFLAPAGTATGTAIVTLSAPGGALFIGTVEVGIVAPGIFALNAQGLAAANVLRVRDGVQTVEDVFEIGAGDAIVARAIDLGPEGDTVFLLLYGTGFRFRRFATSVQATIGGQNARVSFSGAQGDFPGLDQMNIEIPRSLIGRGDVEVRVTVDNAAANAVRIRIR